MTIASEITRLQWAKADIETAIENKGVTVPDDVKLDDYPQYISQIHDGTWLSLFVPATFTMTDVIRNTNESVVMEENVLDTLSPNDSAYYHYFWFRDSSSTAHSAWRFWVWKKTKWQNPTFSYWNRLEENNYYYYYVKRNYKCRAKFDWNNVVVSSLSYREHYSAGYWISGGDYDYTFFADTATNNSFTQVSLWNWSTGQYAAPDAHIDEVYTAWENATWLQASDTLPSIWYTSISFARGSSNYYTLTATMTV